MELKDQEDWVKLEQKLNELRQQRIKVDEANETLKKKLETLTAHLDTLDAKYAKNEADEITEDTKNSESEKNIKDCETETPPVNQSSESSSS